MPLKRGAARIFAAPSLRAVAAARAYHQLLCALASHAIVMIASRGARSRTTAADRDDGHSTPVLAVRGDMHRTAVLRSVMTVLEPQLGQRPACSDPMLGMAPRKRLRARLREQHGQPQRCVAACATQHRPARQVEQHGTAHVLTTKTCGAPSGCASCGAFP